MIRVAFTVPLSVLYLKAIDRDMPLKVFESPISWLRGDCGGSVILDDVDARWTNERLANDEIALRAWWEAAA